MIERLTIVRHGETLDNARGVTQGWRDSDLSDEGREQIERLARRLATMGVTAVFSSSLPRAIVTATRIAEVLDLDVVELPNLREMNYGEWEGLPFMEIRGGQPEVYERWLADPSYPCPRGESFRDVLVRMQQAIDEVIWKSSGGHPVVVSHGTAIRVAATILLDLPLESAKSFMQQNAAINVFERRQDRWLLRVWNDATHLNGAQG